MALLAKLTSKNQTTIPKEVRKALHLKEKDHIIFEILDDNDVKIRRATPLDVEYLQALSRTLNEWNSQEDEEAYKDL